MSEENVEVAAQDWGRLFAWRLRSRLTSTRRPSCSDDHAGRRGRSPASKRCGRTMSVGGEAWENSDSTVEEVVDGVGDRVFVMARFRGRGRASGAEVKGRHFEVYTVRDRKVIRVEEFSERGEALEAAGLSE